MRMKELWQSLVDCVVGVEHPTFPEPGPGLNCTDPSKPNFVKPVCLNNDIASQGLYRSAPLKVMHADTFDSVSYVIRPIKEGKYIYGCKIIDFKLCGYILLASQSEDCCVAIDARTLITELIGPGLWLIQHDDGVMELISELSLSKRYHIPRF